MNIFQRIIAAIKAPVEMASDEMAKVEHDVASHMQDIEDRVETFVEGPQLVTVEDAIAELTAELVAFKANKDAVTASAHAVKDAQAKLTAVQANMAQAVEGMATDLQAVDAWVG